MTNRAFKSGESREQACLFPARIDDYVEPDNPVRAIDGYVAALDLDRFGFRHARRGVGAGQPPYDPSDLLKLYIYGYLNRIRSSRRLEREAACNLEVIWLLKTLKPGYRTIAKFRKENWAALNLRIALDKTAEMGCLALSGVTYGGIGERTGVPPTQHEIDNVAAVLEAAARHAKSRGLLLGIEPVNRYENHIINTGWQAVAMVEKVGAENMFIHLDTYHMNIEEKGAANGILDARKYLKYIHLSESDRGTPGSGTCDWDEVFAALAAIGFKGGLAMESFINMPPEIANGLSVWRPVAKDEAEVMENGLPFLRNKAKQYKLI